MGADALLAALGLPAPFEKSPLPFWDDDHISKQMLAAHLDPAFSGASRQPDFIDRSVEFITGLLPPADFPRLWDFGCGPGLYTTRLAAKGYAVTGLDLSRRSIAFAREQAALAGLPVHYQVQNYLELEAENACDAAIMIYCDYGALNAEDRHTLLGRVHRCLAPGGRFLLDVFTPAKLAAFKEERSWQAFPKGGFWSAGPHLALQQNCRYPKRVSLEQTVVLEGQRRKSYHIWNQYFTPELLAREAAAAGFELKTTWDDAAGAPHTGAAETLAALLEKA